MKALTACVTRTNKRRHHIRRFAEALRQDIYHVLFIDEISMVGLTMLSTSPLPSSVLSPSSFS